MNAAVVLEAIDSVTVVRMDAGENRFSPQFVADVAHALEKAAGDAQAVVLTGTGKYFSNGLDLEWLSSVPESEGAELIGALQALLVQILACPVPVVAAINGHAFAGGALLAIACDARTMRSDRGYFCLPEIDLGLAFTPGMTALLRARLDPPTAHEAMLTGRRYHGGAAVEHRIVDRAVAEEHVVGEAARLATSLAGKPRETTVVMKQRLYAEPLRELAEPVRA